MINIKKSKNNKLTIFVIATLVVLVIASVFFVSGVYKQGKATSPVFGESPHTYVTQENYAFFSNEGVNPETVMPVTYIFASIFDPSNSNIQISLENPFYSNVVSHIFPNSYYGVSSWIYSQETNPINVNGYIRKDNVVCHFASNPNYNYVANYNYFKIDTFSKKLTVSGNLENVSSGELFYYVSLHTANMDFINSVSGIIPQRPGDFNQTVNITNLFPTRLKDGSYYVYGYVYANANISRPCIRDNGLRSFALTGYYFEVKNNIISNASSMSEEKLTEMVNKETDIQMRTKIGQTKTTTKASVR